MHADDYLFEDIDPGGASSFGVKLLMPRRGTISRFVVVQTSGTLGGFSYTLFNSGSACPEGPIVGDIPAASRLRAIIGTVTVPSASAALSGGGVGGSWAYNGVNCLQVPYSCLDVGDRTRGTLDYALWLRLDVTGAGAKTFAVAVTATQPEYS